SPPTSRKDSHGRRALRAALQLGRLLRRRTQRHLERPARRKDLQLGHENQIVKERLVPVLTIETVERVRECMAAVPRCRRKDCNAWPSAALVDTLWRRLRLGLNQR